MGSSTGMLREGSPFIRSQPLDLDQELTSVNVGGEVLTQECDTRLMEHGQLCQRSGEACQTQAPGKPPENLQRTSQEASGFTEFSYNITREKDGNFTIN